MYMCERLRGCIKQTIQFYVSDQWLCVKTTLMHLRCTAYFVKTIFCRKTQTSARYGEKNIALVLKLQYCISKEQQPTTVTSCSIYTLDPFSCSFLTFSSSSFPVCPVLPLVKRTVWSLRLPPFCNRLGSSLKWQLSRYRVTLRACRLPSTW